MWLIITELNNARVIVVDSVQANGYAQMSVREATLFSKEMKR
jgi:hypothetical protein